MIKKVDVLFLSILMIFFFNNRILGHESEKLMKPPDLVEPDSLSITSQLDSIIVLLRQTNINSNDSIEVKIRRIANDVYKQRNKLAEDALHWAQWIVSILLTAIFLVLAIVGVFTFFQIKQYLKKAEIVYKEKIAQVKTESTKIIKDLIELVEKDTRREMNNALLENNYTIGVSYINKKKHFLAKHHLFIVFNHEYRMPYTCFNLGRCYNEEKDIPKALKYFEMALESTTAKDSKVMVNRIKHEIDKLRKQLGSDLE